MNPSLYNKISDYRDNINDKIIKNNFMYYEACEQSYRNFYTIGPPKHNIHSQIY